MEIRTYRARSMQEAVDLVRRDLGPDASVLHAREVKAGVMSWMGGGRQVEVTASAAISAPRRFAQAANEPTTLTAAPTASPAQAANAYQSQKPQASASPAAPTRPSTASSYARDRDREQQAIPGFFAEGADGDAWNNEDQDDIGPHALPNDIEQKFHEHYDDGFETQSRRAPDRSSELAETSFLDTRLRLQQLAKQELEFDALAETSNESEETKSSRPSEEAPAKPDDHEHPNDLQRQVHANLLDANVNELLAGELVDRIDWAETDDAAEAMRQLSGFVEEDLRIAGAIRVAPGQPRVVALVGPTGVGKTTTIAKLAANFHLRENLRVGLITVDTYRIAAVDQLQTYADIIDLPLKVVATPREMRDAIESMADFDLILMDTAGRSPKDEVKIRELRALLAEAGADEVHLVLSCTAAERHLGDAARKFQEAGVSSLILSKLDESDGLGGLLPMIRESRLPLSYVTLGQNVPDDIQTASARRLADAIVGRGSNPEN